MTMTGMEEEEEDDDDDSMKDVEETNNRKKENYHLGVRSHDADRVIHFMHGPVNVTKRALL